MPRFSKIDGSNRADHPRLEPDDEILYLYEYTSGRDYTFGAANDLISNLKKEPSRAHRPEYRHKIAAMRRCAAEIAEALNPAWLNSATLVPVPPSKARGHPEYDDRMTQICRGIPVSFPIDVRELVIQRESMEAAHISSNPRPTVEELLGVYAIDEALAAPVPQRIGIVDDVLTAGTHYRAMTTVLRKRFPGVPIVGLFIARRVFPPAATAEEMFGDDPV
ncbi:MAG TPA: hypothetical protein VGR52_01540 [Stellaceae bacterium]|nr:hypothetical protein [Stellaceae bacterium]